MIRFMIQKDKLMVMDLIRRTEMFTEPEIAVAEELINIFLNDSNQKDYKVIVVENDRQHVVGYLCYGPTDLTEGTYDLYWMAVSPNQQGRGHGKALLQWLESTVKEEHGRLIIIETSSQPKYESTRQFYLRSGCEEAARIPDFYKPGDDRVIYVKRFDK
jgi:ribosomal protein S18 acetylase RimI-like enzyme